MTTLLKDYKPIPGKIYRLKNDLFGLCEHEEGFEKDMLVSIVTNGKYEDFYQITLDVKPFEDHNKPLEQPVFTDGLTWSETGFSPYKESSKPIQLFYEGDKKFEDFFEEDIPFKVEIIPGLVTEEFEYRGFKLQQVNLKGERKWYCLYNNSIVNVHHETNLLKLWIDSQYNEVTK